MPEFHGLNEAERYFASQVLASASAPVQAAAVPPERNAAPPERNAAPPERNAAPPERNAVPPERHAAPPERNAAPPAPESAPAAAIFHRIHELLFAHPAATQAVFAALVAEGRQFARTQEGGALARQLRGSDLVARARMLWEVLGMSAFTEHEQGLPSVVLNEFARAISQGELEPALARLFEASQSVR